MSKSREDSITLEEVNMRRGVDLSPGAINSPEKPPVGLIPRWRWEQERCLELMQAIARRADMKYLMADAELIGGWAIELVEHLERIKGVEFDPDEEEEQV